MRGVEEFKGILFFVLPFHVFLFVANRIPPDIKETIGPCAAFDEEGAKVEAAAVLGNNKIDGRFFAVADG